MISAQVPSRSWGSGADVAVCPTTRNRSLTVAAQKHAQNVDTNADAADRNVCATDQWGCVSKKFRQKLKIQLPAVDLASRRPNFQNSENQTSKTIYSPDGAGPKPPPHRTYRADREKKRL